LKRLRLYLETSVWNVYFDEESPDRREETRRLVHGAPELGYDLFVSDVLLFEIGKAWAERQEQISGLLKKVRPVLLERTPEVDLLAEAYLSSGALPAGSKDDAFHIAFATAHELDVVVSWNLRHIANVRRQQRVQAVNMTNGFYKPILLTTPLEVIENE